MEYGFEIKDPLKLRKRGSIARKAFMTLILLSLSVVIYAHQDQASRYTDEMTRLGGNRISIKNAFLAIHPL